MQSNETLNYSLHVVRPGLEAQLVTSQLCEPEKTS